MPRVPASCLLLLLAMWFEGAPASVARQNPAPLRFVTAGLVHGHAEGLFRQYFHSPNLQVRNHLVSQQPGRVRTRLPARSGRDSQGGRSRRPQRPEGDRRRP